MKRFFVPVCLSAVLLCVYLATIAPGLTWANDGADGGDLITAAASGGVAHPTGYPTYLILAKLFQFIPVGSLAFRTNLLSTTAAVVAAILLYGLVVWLPESPARGNWLAGSAAALLFGLSPLLWSQAVITEVYALQAALTAGCFLLCLWEVTEEFQVRLQRAGGLILGLAAGNHLTTLFLVPALLVAASWRGSRKINGRAFLRLLGWFLAGLSIYLVLPLLALSNSPVNWGRPSTPIRFMWLVTGKLYQTNLLNNSLQLLPIRIQAWFSLMLEQFGWVGIILALFGLIYFFKPTRLYFVSLWCALVFTGFALWYDTFDSYIYLLPVLFSVSLWAGLGLGGLMRDNRLNSKSFRLAMGLLLAVFFVWVGYNRWSGVDASRDVRAEQFGSQAMQILPDRAFVFVTSDRAIFSLWYFHFALGQRPDIVLVAKELLGYDWYDETLRMIYPQVQWPETMAFPETISFANPLRPVCNLSYFEKAEMTCHEVESREGLLELTNKVP